MAKTSYSKFLCTSALVAAVAAPAMAQELTFGDFSGAYDLYTVDDDSITVFRLNGEVEFTVDQFVLGAGLDSETFTPEGSDSISISNYFASAGYMPIDGVLVGAELTGTRFASGGDSDSIDGYGLFAQYQADQFGVAVRYSIPVSEEEEFSTITYFGQAAVTPEVAVSAIVETANEVDERFYMLRAEYEAGPIDATAYYAAVTDVDGSLFGVNLAYQVNNQLRVLADYQTTSDGIFGDSNAYSIGGGYQVADSVWIDGTLGQLSGDGEDVTTFGLEVSYEIGGQKRLDRALLSAAQDDFGSGVLGISPFSTFGSGLFFGL